MGAFLEPGDEIIVFEPVFEFYISQAEIYGAKPKFFAMDEPKEDSDEWTINFEKLESCFNEKTRMIILNTPHNPTGKMLTKDELEKVTKILAKYPRVIVLSDEVIHISLSLFLTCI
jgi:aspartate/methionine/tyrosine aminotransferase